jgi:hypothetical protein
MANDNPLRQIHNALWAMLEASSDFCSFVAPENRIKFNGDALPADTPQISTGSTPEVRVLHVGLEPHLQRTSDRSSVVARWEIQIHSGDDRLLTDLDIEWAILRALVDWQTHLQALAWQGQPFVEVCRPVTAEAANTNRKGNRGIKAWRAVWAGEIRMWFRTSDLALTP